MIGELYRNQTYRCKLFDVPFDCDRCSTTNAIYDEIDDIISDPTIFNGILQNKDPLEVNK
jgi:hypothetical protein